MPRCRPALALAATPAVFALAAAVVAPTSAAAQPVASAGALTLALGTDLGGWDRVLGRDTHGVAAQLGYERRVGAAGSPFALRLAGDVWRSGAQTFAVATPPGTPEQYAETYTVRRRTSIAGASLFGVWYLPALGVVRPHALAGVGVYRYRGDNVADLDGPVAYGAPKRATSLGYGGGLGAGLGAGAVRPFAELRYTQLSGLGSSGVSAARTRLSLGARVAF